MSDVSTRRERGVGACDEIVVISSGGERSTFSVDRYVRDAVGRGAEHSQALEEALFVLDGLRASGLREVTTDALRHAVVEHDPQLLCRRPTASVAIDIGTRYLSTVATTGRFAVETTTPTAEAFTDAAAITAPFVLTVADRPAALLSGATFDPVPPLQFEAVSEALVSAGIGPFLIEGFASRFPALLTDIDVEALIGDTTTLSFEEREARIGQKTAVLNLVATALDRLYKELFLQGFTPAGIIEVIRRKYGSDAAERIASEAAGRLGFESAEEAAKRAGSRRLFTALLKTLKGSNLLFFLVELGLIARAVVRLYEMDTKYDLLYAALHDEQEALGNPAVVIDPGERRGVGGKIGTLPDGACEAFIEYVTTFLNDAGDFDTEMLAGPTRVTPGMEYSQDIVVPRRGSYQFFIVQFRVVCPGQDDTVIVVVRQAVRRA
jgi:hypothetical protein